MQRIRCYHCVGKINLEHLDGFDHLIDLGTRLTLRGDHRGLPRLAHL